jgi:hypothetical protein
LERILRDKTESRSGGGLKDRPHCERCGRPIKVSSDDYERDELLCTHCAAEAKAWAIGDYEPE